MEAMTTFTTSLLPCGLTQEEVEELEELKQSRSGSDSFSRTVAVCRAIGGATAPVLEDQHSHFSENFAGFTVADCSCT